MVRFFVLPEEMGENFLVLTGENAAHAKVLRLKVGDPVTVCDGEGRECGCTVSDVSPGQVSLVVHHRGASQSEAAVQVRIFTAFPKADKLEHVIQKATELGAAEIIAFPGARCVSRPEERALGKKLERWQKIAASAAEQSGRGRIP
ncbi:MAG: RsmE family RNA methyltransferase [Oscillospiraceae bacterium]